MTTTTTFTGLETNRSPGRQSLQPGQVSQLVVSDLETGTERVVFEVDTVIESPNWTPDGRWFIVNGSGKLFRVPADGSGGLEQIPIGAVSGVNNDHVLSPDGQRVYFSASGHLYCVDVEGGDARRVSNVHPPSRSTATGCTASAQTSQPWPTSRSSPKATNREPDATWPPSQPPAGPTTR
jgi:Tol biopolymer transport system component